MRRKLPPLNAVRTFEAVARNLSFRKASEELFVSEPAVSRSIKILEEHFQTRLFERLPRGLELTMEGKLLLGPASRALDELDAASSQLYRANARTRLSILATPYISAHWLVPRLGPFFEAHPELDVEILNGVDSEFFLSTNFDVAIWWGSAQLEGYDMAPFLCRTLLPAATPELIARIGADNLSDFVAKSRLLHEFDYQYWNKWLKIAGVSGIDAARGIVFSNYNSLVQATARGLGVSLLLRPLFDHNDGAMRLVVPFDTQFGIEVPYFVVWRKDAVLGREALAFIDFVMQSAEA